MHMIRNTLKRWLPIALAISAASGLVYTIAQQLLRMGANDPQIQMAEDAAAALTRGESVESVIPSHEVDLAQSLAPFIVVYDAQSNVLASSVQLRDQTPGVPEGVFGYVAAAWGGSYHVAARAGRPHCFRDRS